MAGAELILVEVDDEVRGVSETVQLHRGHTVAASLRRLIDLFGLPWRTVDRKPLTYRLARPGPDGEGSHFAEETEVADLQLVEGDRLVLSSPDASAAWVEINALIGQVEDELRLQATDFRDQVTEEVRADVSRRLTGIRAEIERVARSRLLGDGARPSLRSRLRARRLIRRVAGTGISPDEVAGVRVGLSQLTTAASMAFRAAPFVAGAAVVGASAVAVEAADDDLSADEVEQAIHEAVDDALDQQPDGGGEDGGGGEDDEEAIDPVVAGLREAVRAELDLIRPDLLTAEQVEDIVAGAVASLPENEAFLGVIRREVPGAEVDGVTSSALGGLTRETPSRPLAAGETLWSVAVDVRADPTSLGCEPGPFAESVAVHVRRIWAANAGTLGGDPDRIDPAAGLRVPCPQ